jgi:hypothetical protein
MIQTTRRRFLQDVGCGAIAAVATPAFLRGSLLSGPLGDRITFGALEPLATLMQESSGTDLLPKVVKKLREGVPLRDLAAAAALANARTFGGEDYVGYHCAMALMPAWQMAARMPDQKLAPLPVLKVLVRNTTRIEEFGGPKRETLTKVEAADSGGDAASLVAAERGSDVDLAERLFARAMQQGDLAAFEALQELVRDNVDVHQVVLAWRAWDMLQLTGREHAHAMLRQSMRHCVDRERGRVRSNEAAPGLRALLPRLIEEHRLGADSRPGKGLDDAGFETLSRTIFAEGKDRAAAAAAAALADGIDPEAVGEAISLAAVRLVLHDRGASRASAGKPQGSVHGASVGVHASDSANAWRGIARVSGHRNRVASLVAAAWHTAGQSRGMDHEFPVHASGRERAERVPSADLVAALDGAIREREQALAASIVERYGKLEQPPEPVVRVLLDHAVTHDGALHNEKFFQTAVESFQSTRPSSRWLHLAALARVCASSFGIEAPGLAEARRLLSG